MDGLTEEQRRAIRTIVHGDPDRPVVFTSTEATGETVGTTEHDHDDATGAAGDIPGEGRLLPSGDVDIPIAGIVGRLGRRIGQLEADLALAQAHVEAATAELQQTRMALLETQLRDTTKEHADG